MSENAVFRSIFRRSAPKSILLLPGQLLPGQAAFADDSNELLYRKRLNASVNGGSVVTYLPSDQMAQAPHIHIQETPQIVWTINHRRDTLEPNVVVYNSQGRQGFAQVDVVDRDNLTITFGAAEYGRAKVS